MGRRIGLNPCDLRIASKKEFDESTNHLRTKAPTKGVGVTDVDINSVNTTVVFVRPPTAARVGGAISLGKAEGSITQVCDVTTDRRTSNSRLVFPLNFRIRDGPAPPRRDVGMVEPFVQAGDVALGERFKLNRTIQIRDSVSLPNAMV